MNYTTKPAGSSASSMIVDAKRAARAAAIAQRDAIPASDRACMATVLASVDLPFVGRGNIVSAYYPIGSEMDVLPLLTHLVAEGARTALPIVEGRGKPLQFRIWAPGDSLERGVLNIPVPFASARQRVPSILLVPLLAFDHEGFRLGYGASHYDCTLADLRAAGTVLAVGIGFAAQEMPAVPHECHDQPLDWVVTENGAIRCHPEKRL